MTPSRIALALAAALCALTAVAPGAAAVALPAEGATGVRGCSEHVARNCYWCKEGLAPVWGKGSTVQQVEAAG